MTVPLNKNSFWQHSQQLPFSTKTNPRENRKFAVGLTIGGEKGSYDVKIKNIDALDKEKYI